MRTQKIQTQEYEFYLADLDNSVLVESSEDNLVIRTSRNNFSDRRKSSFLRQLATEGFIPEGYQSAGQANGFHPQATWIVDPSWLKLDPAWTQRSNQFIKRLFLYGGLLWAALMVWIFF